MQRIIYIIIFAIVLLIFKAFFLDSYLKERSMSEANASAETVQPSEPAPVVESAPHENNVSGLKAPKKTLPRQEKEEMPLDKLGDDLTKHITL
jgi:hypothetical protein